jgi:hypothetical protein
MIERDSQLAAVSGLLERPGPALIVVQGRPGMGLPSFLGHALKGAHQLRFRFPDLADEDQRALLEDSLDRVFGSTTGPIPEVRPVPSLRRSASVSSGDRLTWEGILASVTVRATSPSPRTVLTLESMERAAPSSPRLSEALALGWNAIRRRSTPLVLVLTGSDPEVMDQIAGPDSPLGSAVDARLTLDPLTIRGTSELLSRWRPRDRALAWALLGGVPGRLALLDTSRSLRRNMVSLLLDPSGPLHREMDGLVGGIRSLTHPARYGSLLRAVALGARTWSEIRRAFPGEGDAGRPGPYAERLRSLGLLGVEISLDARVGSRKRRYRVTDPLLTWWYRFVVPRSPELAGGEARRIWIEEVEPRLPQVLSASLAGAVRDLLIKRGAEVLGSEARETGAIWNPECEIPIAGTLRNGAVFYGLDPGATEPPGIEHLRHLEAQISETRYGFGRERRLRIVTSLAEPDTPLKAAAARQEGVRILGPRELLGEALA